MKYLTSMPVVALLATLGTCVPWSSPVAAAAGGTNLTPPSSQSGWYDAAFGVRGRQLTDVGRINVSPRPAMADEVRFLHRRFDGYYLATGPSLECDNDWTNRGPNQGCREVLSLAQYTLDGRLISSAGRNFNSSFFPSYFDTYGPPDLSGMEYYPAFAARASEEALSGDTQKIDPLVMPAYSFSGTIPYEALPPSFHPIDSALPALQKKLFVLGELTFRGSGCLTYEQPMTGNPIAGQPPCVLDRAPLIVSYDSRLVPDWNLRNTSQRTLRLVPETNSTSIWRGAWDTGCLVTRYTALAMSKERIYIGGYRQDSCISVLTPRYLPFVVALRPNGTVDPTFATSGLWRPAWLTNGSRGGAISDLQLDASGNLIVLAGKWNGSALGTVLVKLSANGFMLAFNGAALLSLGDIPFSIGERGMVLALGPLDSAFVFAPFGGHLGRISSLQTGARTVPYGLGQGGRYDARADLADLSRRVSGGTPPWFSDVIAVCNRSAVLVGTIALAGGSQPFAVILNSSGARAKIIADEIPATDSGTITDNYTDLMISASRGQGFTGFFDASLRRLLIAGSAGRFTRLGNATNEFDFALSARHLACADLE